MDTRAWAILDSLEDQLMVIDRAMRITQINEAFLRTHRLQKSEVIGRPCYVISDCPAKPGASQNDECPAPKVWEGGEPVRVYHIRQTSIEGAADAIHLEIVASPLKDNQGNTIEMIELARDVTEVRRMQEQVVALGAIASTVCQSLDLDTVLNLALDKVLTFVKAGIGGILLLDEGTQLLSYRVYRGLSSEFVQGIAGLRLGEGIAGKVAQAGEPIYVGDISQDPRLTRPVVISEGLRSFASVPLRSKNKILGVMNVASYAPRQFGPQDVQLLTSVADQIAVAIENAKLYSETQRMAETRRQLLRRIISGQEEERKRIARELHDDTSQVLSSLAVNMQALADALPRHPEQVKARLTGLQAVVANLHDGLRRTMHELRPSLLDDYGLVAAIRWLSEHRLGAAGLEVHLETHGMHRRLPIEVETALFRIAQEGGTNVIRHADATQVVITVDFNESTVAVRIEDNGKGFDPKQVMVSERGQGMGLLGMRERAELVGGELTVDSGPGIGTRISVEVPITPTVSNG